MKILLTLIACISLSAARSFCQKSIDIEACKNFERLEEIEGKACLLSANGKYVMYKVYSEKKGYKHGVNILKNLKTGVEEKLENMFDARLFDNDRMFVVHKRGDSLMVLNTETGKQNWATNIRGYFVAKLMIGDVVAFFSEKAGKPLLTLWDVKRNQKNEIHGLRYEKYWLNKDATGLLAMGSLGLIYTDLKTRNQMTLSQDTSLENAVFSNDGKDIAYILKSDGGYELKSVNVHSRETKVLLKGSWDFLSEKRRLDRNTLHFERGNVFFKMTEPIKYSNKKTLSVLTKDLTVWSYQDLELQTQQLINLDRPILYTSMINVRSGKMVQLESDSLRLELTGNTDKYRILTTRLNDREFYWNKQKQSIYLFSVVTGELHLIKEANYPGISPIGISPNNKFLIWFDGKDGKYYSYNIESHKVCNISGTEHISFRNINRGRVPSDLINSAPHRGTFWVNNSSAMIVHAENDIWQLDLAGVRAPINLTNYYGDRSDIRFRLVDIDNSSLAPKMMTFNDGGIMVWAFNYRLKQNGFWLVRPGKSVDPTKLIMSDDAYHFQQQSSLVAENDALDPIKFKPVKAAKSNVFIFRRMNSSHPPNLFFTTDFKQIKQISNIVQDKDYVQDSTKLVTYSLPNGRVVEGILHLPTNMDVTKKYPIIFNYYERRSESLNLYKMPDLSGHNINIPWYISRGYLVFEPDFYYERGKTAASVINSIKSAVAELSKLSFIDTARMGAQGQSFGGYESNVLAIQTNLFKAVCAMAGPTNIISEYGSIRPDGDNNQLSADKGQRNLGVFPWEHPEVFIDNSPNFHIQKANTPLLLVHNKGDRAISFSQVIELYLGMRRIGKKVWLLEYDGEGHVNSKDENKLDFTIRMQQFFDHYLKDAPAPRWMTRGIPAAMKGIDSGLELDTEIKTPGEGIARPVAPGKVF